MVIWHIQFKVIWISDTGKLLMLICSVYLPHNLCLSPADRVFLTWRALNVPNLECWWEDAQAPHLLSSTVGLLWFDMPVTIPLEMDPSPFPEQESSPVLSSRSSFQHENQNPLSLMCLFSYWQMYWPTFYAICHCLIFLNVWHKDKCYSWSRDLLAFLLQVAFGMNW